MSNLRIIKEEVINLKENLEGMDKNIKALQKVIKKEFKIELSKSEIVRMILLHSMPCYNYKLTVKEALMEAKYL